MRLFIAIPFSYEIKEEFEKWQEIAMDLDPKARYPETGNLHLTLQFLGEVPPSHLPELKEVINTTALKHQAFSCTFNKAGFFKRSDKAILWIAATDGNHQLKQIHKDILFQLKALKYKFEKKTFKAHVTIARGFKKEYAGDFQHSKGPKIECMIDEISLFQSDLRPEGPLYSELHSAKLK